MEKHANDRQSTRGTDPDRSTDPSRSSAHDAEPNDGIDQQTAAAPPEPREGEERRRGDG
jgi:hypothetical protein